MKQAEAFIFDLDGTLFKAETLLLPAYYAAFDQLRKEGLHEGETPPEALILGGLGMLLDEIWNRVLPNAEPEVRNRANELLLLHQTNGLRQGGGELYEGVGETLSELNRRGYRLFIASNGLEAYVKGVIESKDLLKHFEGIYSAGEYGTATKVELVRLLMDRHGIRKAWMVGDRSSDVEAGKMNGLYVAGCQYAQFGAGEELKEADCLVSSVPELLRLA